MINSIQISLKLQTNKSYSILHRYYYVLEFLKTNLENDMHLLIVSYKLDFKSCQ
jgi:hypothetical protein